jgi:hypothetical protein
MDTLEAKSAAPLPKDQVRNLLNTLPDDCTLDDVQYGLFVLAGIQKGQEEIDRGLGIPQEEVERQVKKWLTK